VSCRCDPLGMPPVLAQSQAVSRAVTSKLHSLRQPTSALQVSLSALRCASKARRRCLAQGRMKPAEVARTITSLVSHGTLSTVDENGVPLGTYVTFVLDDAGCPLIRLRSDASHTANLKRNSKCTIFAHPSEMPARQLARVTLLGEVEDISEEEASEAAARHSAIYASAIGVDAPQSDDMYMRLDVHDCFYVAGLGVRNRHCAQQRASCVHSAFYIPIRECCAASTSQRITRLCGSPDHLLC
jgi:Pyridoxamine 5'-phosphate oxidase